MKHWSFKIQEDEGFLLCQRDRRIPLPDPRVAASIENITCPRCKAIMQVAKDIAEKS